MDLPFRNATRIPLLLSRGLADRLIAADEATYTRVSRAIHFAEQALELFYECHWTPSSPVPMFDGILLDIRFHRPSERFYVFDFIDLGEGPSPTSPGGIAIGALADLLRFSGLEPDEVVPPPMVGSQASRTSALTEANPLTVTDADRSPPSASRPSQVLRTNTRLGRHFIHVTGYLAQCSPGSMDSDAWRIRTGISPYAINARRSELCRGVGQLPLSANDRGQHDEP